MSNRGDRPVAGGAGTFVVYVVVFLYHDLFDPGRIVDFDHRPFLSLAERDVAARALSSCHSCEPSSHYYQGTQQGSLGPVASDHDCQYHS